MARRRERRYRQLLDWSHLA